MLPLCNCNGRRNISYYKVVGVSIFRTSNTRKEKGP